MPRHRLSGFTLIELLVVVAIIALLVSMLLPSLGRAREQAKSVHCAARLHDFGNGIQSYANDFSDFYPPAEFHKRAPSDVDSHRDVYRYGWTELLWSYVYREDLDMIFTPADFPILRNVDGHRWVKYMLCRTSKRTGQNSGHYRVYLPTWSFGSYQVGRLQPWQLTLPDGTPNDPDPWSSAMYSSLRPKLVLIGDANDRSYAGDGALNDDSSYINAGEANEGGVDGNRFSDRHGGFTNYLFADLHAEKDAKLRETLARDWDLNGVVDIAEAPIDTP